MKVINKAINNFKTNFLKIVSFVQSESKFEVVCFCWLWKLKNAKNLRLITLRSFINIYCVYRKNSVFLLLLLEIL